MKQGSVASKYFVYFAVLTAQFGIFLTGVFYSWSSPILIKLSGLDDNPLGRTIVPTEEVWIITIGSFGMWIGSCLSGELARRIGRRPSLIVMTFPLLISFVILIFAKHIWLIFLARILGGVTNGGMFTILPIYFGELTDPTTRGVLGAAFNLFLNVGLLFSLSIGPYTSFTCFNLILAICVSVYAVLIILIIPESPYYLVEKDIDKAEEALKSLRGVDNVKEELKQIQQYVELEAENRGSFSEIIGSKTARKSLIIGVAVACFQQTSGISIIMGFGQTLFEEVDDFIPSDISLIILGFSQVVFGLIAPIFTNKYGRKSLLVFSYSGISLSLIVFGLYFFLKIHSVSVSAISWLPLTSMTIFMFVFGIGSGAVTFIVLGEIFPSRLKGQASSLANILGSITGLLLTNGYSLIKEQIGTGLAFWILSSFSIAAVIFSHFYLIETKGRSLKEIQELLNKSEIVENESIELKV